MTSVSESKRLDKASVLLRGGKESKENFLDSDINLNTMNSVVA